MVDNHINCPVAYCELCVWQATHWSVIWSRSWPVLALSSVTWHCCLTTPASRPTRLCWRHAAVTLRRCSARSCPTTAASRLACCFACSQLMNWTNPVTSCVYWSCVVTWLAAAKLWRPSVWWLWTLPACVQNWRWVHVLWTNFCCDCLTLLAHRQEWCPTVVTGFLSAIWPRHTSQLSVKWLSTYVHMSLCVCACLCVFCVALNAPEYSYFPFIAGGCEINLVIWKCIVFFVPFHVVLSCMITKQWGCCGQQ